MKAGGKKKPKLDIGDQSELGIRILSVNAAIDAEGHLASLHEMQRGKTETPVFDNLETRKKVSS